MKKVLSLLSVVFLSSVGSMEKKENFKYSYTIVSNSNDISDLMYMYNVKEKIIDDYENLVFNVNENHHHEIIQNSIEIFSGDDYRTEYRNGVLHIVIGEGKGNIITGDLRKNSCDSKPVRVQLFFSKFFS